MEKLFKLERFQVLVNYCMGDLYDSICEELKAAPIKSIVLGADEGIGRNHVQASMRFSTLEYFELIRLGTLGDLESLDHDWVFPSSLVELVLTQPYLPGDDLRFLLSHVKRTLRRLTIDFGHLAPDNGDDGTTGLIEADLEAALLESGADWRFLELRWPYCNTPFLNEAVRGLFSLEELVTSGPTCDPGLIDSNCHSKLIKMSFDVIAGSEPPKHLRLTQPNGRSSNLIHYHLYTFVHDPSWEQSVPNMLSVKTRTNQSIPLDEWPKESIEEWREVSNQLEKNGIKLTADFL